VSKKWIWSIFGISARDGKAIQIRGMHNAGQRDTEESTMQWLKDIVTKGIYYSHIGISDYVAWSQKMIMDFGNEIIPQIKDIRRWSLILDSSVVGNMTKLNCWQFMGCGLQMRKRCSHLSDTCPCPASVERSLDGIHGGRNAGRVCWVVLQTQCYGSVQKTYEQKYKTCLLCDFYHSVVDEEDTDFLTSYVIRSP
jgi:hypothetical protein